MEFPTETENLNSIYALFKEVSNLSNVDMCFIKSKQQKGAAAFWLYHTCRNVLNIAQISIEFHQESFFCDDSVIGCNILEREKRTLSFMEYKFHDLPPVVKHALQYLRYPRYNIYYPRCETFCCVDFPHSLPLMEKKKYHPIPGASV